MHPTITSAALLLGSGLLVLASCSANDEPSSVPGGSSGRGGASAGSGGAGGARAGGSGSSGHATGGHATGGHATGGAGASGSGGAKAGSAGATGQAGQAGGSGGAGGSAGNQAGQAGNGGASSGAAGSGASGGTVGGNGGAVSGNGGAGAAGGSAGAGGGVVGACDPKCTGTKMCDDAGSCVCAPGWEASGAECVATPVSAPETRTKAEVCTRLKAETQPVTPLWNPGSGDCDPGTVPYPAQVAALRYLNFYRWMLGVGPVQVMPSVSAAEQQCALLLNYSFSHSPPPTTQCYTADGAAACGASLIAGGFSLVSQFEGYGMETDQNLAHRRNVLSVGRAGVWTGASGGSAAMHYGGSYPPLASDPDFVAHPGPGFNVRSKVPWRWFVQKGTTTLPAVDARVRVASTKEPKPMKRYHHYKDFSSFDLDGWTPQADVTYEVELVDDASTVIATFQTTLIDCP